MIVFAAGNKYEASKIESMKCGPHKIGGPDRVLWYVSGKRWIKSKGKFSTNDLIHCVGEIEPVEVKEAA